MSNAMAISSNTLQQLQCLRPDVSASLEVEIFLERDDLFGQEICRYDVLLVLAKGRSRSRGRDPPLSPARVYLLPAYQLHHIRL